MLEKMLYIYSRYEEGAHHPASRITMVWFRETLIRDSELRQSYEEHKRAILAMGIDDSLEYCKAKGPFVSDMLKTRHPVTLAAESGGNHRQNPPSLERNIRRPRKAALLQSQILAGASSQRFGLRRNAWIAGNGHFPG